MDAHPQTFPAILPRQTPSADISKPLVVILGPTASGKSALALAIAKRHGGEIVNCDSIQIYRGFDIGSAKLPPTEWQEIAHHMLDVAGPGDDFTAGDYSRAARGALNAISTRGGLPIVCGGSGFYLRALLCGLSPAPPRSEMLRERLSRLASRRPSSLHRLLARADSRAAARIHPNDRQKLIRALEIAYIAGAAPSKIQEEPRDALTGYHILKIGLNPDRGQLYSRLDARTAFMFRNGLVEETRNLLALGYSAESKPMQSLGYAQALRILSGDETLETALSDCQTKTRQYAKRQMTWFRAESNVHWLRGFGTDSHVMDEALQLAAGLRPANCSNN